MDLTKLKIGDFIEIESTKKLVEYYIKQNILTKLNIDVLIELARLKENEKYEISDVCVSCKFVKVKNNNLHIMVHFPFIKHD